MLEELPREVSSPGADQNPGGHSDLFLALL